MADWKQMNWKTSLSPLGKRTDDNNKEGMVLVFWFQFGFNLASKMAVK